MAGVDDGEGTDLGGGKLLGRLRAAVEDGLLLRHEAASVQSGRLRATRQRQKPRGGRTQQCEPTRGVATDAGFQRNALSSTVAMYSPSSPRIMPRP